MPAEHCDGPTYLPRLDRMVDTEMRPPDTANYIVYSGCFWIQKNTKAYEKINAPWKFRYRKIQPVSSPVLDTENTYLPSRGGRIEIYISMRPPQLYAVSNPVKTGARA